MGESEEKTVSNIEEQNYGIRSGDENKNNLIVQKSDKDKKRSHIIMLLVFEWVLVAVVLGYFVFSVVKLDFISTMPILMYLIALIIITLLQMFFKNDYMLFMAKTFLAIIPLIFTYSYFVMLFLGMLGGMFAFILLPEIIEVIKQYIDYTSLALVFCLIIMCIAIIVAFMEFNEYKITNSEKAEQLQEKYLPHSRRNVMFADLSLAAIFALVLIFPFVKKASFMFFIIMSVFFGINFLCGLIFKNYYAVKVKSICAVVAFFLYFILTGGIQLSQVYTTALGESSHISWVTILLCIIMIVVLAYQLKLQTDYKKLLSPRLKSRF